MSMTNVLREDESAVVSTLGDRWTSLNGSRLLITGGTGFVGKWLLGTLQHARDLHHLDLEVVVPSRAPARFLNENDRFKSDRSFTFIESDIREFAPSGSFTHVIHAATDVSKAVSSPLEMVDVNVNGTLRALDIAKKSGARTFLLVSSGAVYGPQPEDRASLPEDYLGNSALDVRHIDAYTASKRMTEWMTLNSDLAKTSIARCFAFAGPHLDLSSPLAFAQILKSVVNKTPIRLTGDGKATRSYMYAADLAVWLWTIFFDAENKAIYNVGSDQEISIKDLAQTMVDVTGTSLPIEVAGASNANAKRNRYIPAIEKAKRDLGLTVQTSLRDTILKSVSHASQLGLT